MNIINAIIHLVRNPICQLTSHYKSKNRANQAGSALEEYVKDLFTNGFELSENERVKKCGEVFSYLGNNNNPPDAMLREGDAIEVKKIESPNAKLALNSSYPKYKLFANSPMISKNCKNAELNWKEKDLIYVVGVVKNNNLRHLCMVYGVDYCAEEEIYTRIKSTIKYGVEDIQGIEFSETKELGRINKIDPLGITDLRVRGMWQIENPWVVFNYIYTRDLKNNFDFICLINEDKWESFENKDELFNMQSDRLKISDVEIKNPNNPAQLKRAKLITYYF